MVVAHPIETEVTGFLAHYNNDLTTIRLMHDSGEDARVIVREISDATDTFLLRLLMAILVKTTGSDELPPHILLLAQGGYGRREMHPKSDIDIIFLHNKPLSKDDEEVIKTFLRTLFDLGFVVGHALREHNEAVTLAQNDIEVQTALCESRFLIGDWRMFEEFKQGLWRALGKRRYEYIQRKVDERTERIRKYGATINISEPHIKEGPGGLRDYHVGLWVSSLLQSRTMNLLQLKRVNLIDDLLMREVEHALSFLWGIRTDLHFSSGKEQDVLLMPLQHEVSLRLGYTDKGGRLAEEQMMRDYYKHTLALRRFAEAVIKKAKKKPFFEFLKFNRKTGLSEGFFLCNQEIFIPQNIYFFEHNPQRLLLAFIHAAEQDAILSDIAADAVRDDLELIDHVFIHNKQNADLIRKLFSLKQGIEKSLREMRRTGFLERLFPEWKDIAHLVRYDLVHRYTVDEHSLLCLFHLETLLDDSLQFAQDRFALWYNCSHRDVLRLAVLFHDIGKGKTGDHSVVGARIVDTIARRIRLPEFKRKLLVFLVENHLIMSRTAQRRDITDPAVVTEFSDGLEQLEHLNMLYLLTYVDIKSVSPESMNEWKNNLLYQLYQLTRKIFIMGTASDEREEKEVSRKENFVHILAQQFDTSFVREHLDNLPASYDNNNTPDQIRKHLAAVKAFDGKTPVCRFYPHIDPFCREMLVVSLDHIGLFYRLCASVSLENFTIVEARLNTRKDGIVVNNIVIRDAIDGAQISEQRQSLLRDRLVQTLQKEEFNPPQRAKPKVKNLGRTTIPVSAKILNDVSTRYTVLEVRCQDHSGLLQNLTRIVASRDVNIHFARIITEGVQVTDVFYIAGLNGEKVYDEQETKELHDALMDYLTNSQNS